ncbi:MAG: cytochrome c [Bryobacteraceae bacterium]
MKFTTIAVFICAGVFALPIFAAGDATAGKAVFDKSCKSCHGATGVANPAIAKMMKVEMKDLGSAEAQGLSNEAMEKIIKTGQGKMKPIASVTGKSVDDVVAFVRTLKK